MSDQDYPFGYCTNVHAGTTLPQAQENLLTHAAQVRELVCPTGRLPVGLWLAENVAESLLEGEALPHFRDWLQQHNFLAYTFNGFPQGDFHQEVVKHRVYEPTWTCHSRARYTMMLVEILDVLLPAGQNGSISTLPLGWPYAPWHAENKKESADNLLEVARFCDRIAQASGREIVIAIEPEPGCVLNTAEEVVEFFEHFLFQGPDAQLARKYMSVCHDVCHSSVMFEPQAEALELYRSHGVRVGKVQVSSAVHVPWDQHETLSRAGDWRETSTMLEQLRGFDEPKYLHQATRRHLDPSTGKPEDAEAPVHHIDLLEDLSLAMQRWLPVKQAPDYPWRVHFHVPIYLEHFGELRTTQADIHAALGYLSDQAETSVEGTPWFTGHYEVETYAWTVLPPELSEASLATGIAKELQYFRDALSQSNHNRRPQGVQGA